MLRPLLLANIVMKGPLTPVLFLIAGGLLFTAGLFVALTLVVALLLMVLAAAALIACLVTKNQLASASGRIAINISAALGIVLVLLGFAGIYFAHWFKAVGG